VSGLGVRSRGSGIPRGAFGGTGAYAGQRQRSLLRRAFAKRGYLRQMDWVLVLATGAIAAAGVLLVWSATQPALRAAGENPHTYLKKQLLYVAIGAVVMFALATVDHRQFKLWAPLAYILALLAVAAVLTPLGDRVQGATAWIKFPGFQVEPSEFAKLGLILMTALILSSPRGLTRRPGIREVALALLAAAPLIVGVEREPALGTTLVLCVVLAAMILVSGILLRWVLGLTAVVAAGIYAVATLHLLRGYQLTRLTSFLHPSADLAGAGYNELQAKIAVGSGGMFGQGLFHGTFTAGNFVPAQQTDFIFTVAGEQLGFVGCVAIICLLGVVILRAIRIAATADDQFGMLVASGVAVWFAFQSFVNIGMTIGLMPITGLPLPFVSYGGSAILADMIAVGLLLSIHRHRSVFDS
jgi:rod shape determining protein RodA